MNSQSDIRAALIGCGAISKKHVAALAALAGTVQLAHLCDIDHGRVAQISEVAKAEAGWAPRPWGDYKPMLAEAGPDAVAIATASHLHAQMAVDAFEAGAHVLIEKPIGLNTTDIDRILGAEREAGKVGTVGYILRFNPHIRALKNAVDVGRFGRVLHASMNIHMNRNTAYYEQARWRGTWSRDGGALMNQGTHGIDILQWIVGSPARRVSGVVRRFQRPIEAEDFGTALVEFESGAVATIVGSVNVYPTNHDMTLSVFGETGTVVLGGRGLNEVVTWTFDDEQPGEAESVRTLAMNPANDPVGHHALYADFLEAIRTGRKPLVTLEDAARSVQIVLGIYRSAKEGRPVDVPTQFSTTDMIGYFD